MPQLMQSGLAWGALLTPAQSPKCEVTPILGGQHAGGLTPLPHAQCNAGACTCSQQFQVRLTEHTALKRLMHTMQRELRTCREQVVTHCSINNSRHLPVQVCMHAFNPVLALMQTPSKSRENLSVCVWVLQHRTSIRHDTLTYRFGSPASSRTQYKVQVQVL